MYTAAAQGFADSALAPSGGNCSMLMRTAAEAGMCCCTQHQHALRTTESATCKMQVTTSSYACRSSMGVCTPVALYVPWEPWLVLKTPCCLRGCTHTHTQNSQRPLPHAGKAVNSTA